jgi:hypothetical protein
MRSKDRCGLFAITDNGIGLNDENFDSFNTAFSDHKLSRGGKGLGRFTWLKAFDKVEIDSTFEKQGEDPQRRRFTFDEDYTIWPSGCQRIVSLGHSGERGRSETNFMPPAHPLCGHRASRSRERHRAQLMKA